LIAEHKPLQHARERAINADQEPSRAREQRRRSWRRQEDVSVLDACRREVRDAR
jgi:hypothetical protein